MQGDKLFERLDAAPIGLRGACCYFTFVREILQIKQKKKKKQACICTYKREFVCLSKAELLSPAVCVPLPSLDVKGFNFLNKMQVKPKPDGRLGLPRANRPFFHTSLL